MKVYGKAITRAVDGITFDVAPGELFGLLGPNGAGKTTTIRILATLLRATEGTPASPASTSPSSPHEVRKRLGLALQTPALDAFSTGRETLELAGRLHRMPRAEIKRRTDELLELMALTNGRRASSPGTYSGGMKRRLDLASALMHQPPLLILDEPTEGLDPQSRTALWEELERINSAGHDHAADDPLHGGGRPALHRGWRSSTTARSSWRARPPSSSAASAPTRSCCS